MIKIKNVYKHPEEGEEFLFELDGKMVVLLGPNGAGKTTMLNSFQAELKKNHIVIFDDPKNIDVNRSYNELFDPEHFVHRWTSEGEKMVHALGSIFRKIGANQKTSEKKEIILLFDSLDSGLSYDRLKEVTDVLFKYILKDVKLIAFSSNSYELCHLLKDQAKFYWVPTNTWIEFPSSFEKFIEMYDIDTH
jgi:energy-coupling factor transporter ATP-binding protein EcfA2